jgi:diaminopimelate decarboxylase
VSEFFAYRGGELFAEEVAIRRLARSLGTPFYLYSAAALAAQYRRFWSAFADLDPLVSFAVKANSNLAVLSLFAALGAGADVVSAGELARALAAGIPPARILFSGVGKTRSELAAALEAGIRQINVESAPELYALSALAAEQGQRAPVALRVNPDIDPRTHAKIATGRRENKFGIAWHEAIPLYRLATELPGIEPVGLAVHIGSQLLDLDPFRRAFERLARLVRELRQSGFPVARVDLGGGIGIRYKDETPPRLEAYAGLVREIFGAESVELAFEPGRFLCGAAGLLLARVLYVKESGGRRIIILDAAMNDLIRPALYEAWHEILPIRLPSEAAPLRPADVVGPICETGDTFAEGRALPPLAAGDLVALTAAGAYGAVMSSTYNSRLLVPEVLVSGERFAVIRARGSYEALLALDAVPGWICEAARELASPRLRRGGGAS